MAYLLPLITLFVNTICEGAIFFGGRNQKLKFSDSASMANIMWRPLFRITHFYALLPVIAGTLLWMRLLVPSVDPMYMDSVMSGTSSDFGAIVFGIFAPIYLTLLLCMIHLRDSIEAKSLNAQPPTHRLKSLSLFFVAANIMWAILIVIMSVM